MILGFDRSLPSIATNDVDISRLGVSKFVISIEPWSWFWKRYCDSMGLGLQLLCF